MWQKFIKIARWYLVPAWHVEHVIEEYKMEGVEYSPQIIFGFSWRVLYDGERGTYFHCRRFLTPWGARKYVREL